VRAGALLLREAVATGADAGARLASAAQQALRSPCWRLQATALAVLGRLSVAPDSGGALPVFLRRE
jgi:hypothetical protein